MSAVELLGSLDLLDEHERIEAKCAFEAGKSVLETVCTLGDAPAKESVTYYVPTERLGGDTEGSRTKFAFLSTNPVGLPTSLEALSDHPEALPPTTTPEEETTRRALLAMLPGELVGRLGACDRRRTPEEAAIVVIKVCRLRAWRAEELALLLHRNSRHVRNSYLRFLMRDGQWVMTKPAESNGPYQAYRSQGGNYE